VVHNLVRGSGHHHLLILAGNAHQPLVRLPAAPVWAAGILSLRDASLQSLDLLRALGLLLTVLDKRHTSLDLAEESLSAVTGVALVGHALELALDVLLNTLIGDAFHHLGLHALRCLGAVVILHLVVHNLVRGSGHHHLLILAGNAHQPLVRLPAAPVWAAGILSLRDASLHCLHLLRALGLFRAVLQDRHTSLHLAEESLGAVAAVALVLHALKLALDVRLHLLVGQPVQDLGLHASSGLCAIAVVSDHRHCRQILFEGSKHLTVLNHGLLLLGSGSEHRLVRLIITLASSAAFLLRSLDSLLHTLHFDHALVALGTVDQLRHAVVHNAFVSIVPTHAIAFHTIELAFHVSRQNLVTGSCLLAHARGHYFAILRSWIEHSVHSWITVHQLLFLFTRHVHNLAVRLRTMTIGAALLLSPMDCFLDAAQLLHAVRILRALVELR